LTGELTALDSLQCDRISTARATFEQLLQQHPAAAAYQIGMANACAMQFEATRTDPAPDVAALRLAESHALNACHIDPHLAEAWATLGFVLERTGRRADALAALERAVVLEPDNWRHQVRLALGSWGEARLRAARRALAQCPQLPLAHWLAATVFVARNALDQAERDVDRALAVAAVESPDAAPYSMVALPTSVAQAMHIPRSGVGRGQNRRYQIGYYRHVWHVGSRDAE